MEDMLTYLGIESIDELFEDIPEKMRTGGLALPDAMEEREVEERIRALLAENKSFFEMPSFLPILKPHYIPPAVDEIVARQEFYTSYTPYQAEASQGMLQALFEYQSVVAELTGMEVANVSMYDSATALGEAALMAHRITGRKKILVPRAMFWHKRSVLENYARGAALEIIEIDHGEDGLMKLNFSGDDIAAIYIENPNFFGIIDRRYDELSKIKERTGALLIAGIDPLHLALFHPPSHYHADIVIGEGYLGNPMNFGGPLLGIFASKKQYLRQMPGRIIGATVDREGKRAFCMTLQTREQHIRRGKATSNICSNQALCCISFLAYVALLGSGGLRGVALQNMENAHYMAERLKEVGFEMPFDAPFFNEFVVTCPLEGKELNKRLLARGMYGGLPIDRYVAKGMLFGVTEMHTRELMDEAVETMVEVVA
ncbi:MAG: aminomethyl-transferring glycine dehydrogenase subunit GcvPA [Thermoplasmata archaeon]|nr:MAG: aminomethyl-transferring glycine dehydrogenase subunit GcvPA [Thermoplasmata archaeon]